MSILLILGNCKFKNASFKTLKWRILGISRIFYIAYENQKYDLYQKYSIMMLDLLFSFKQDEEEQILNKNEEERFIPFDYFYNIYKIQLIIIIKICY